MSRGIGPGSPQFQVPLRWGYPFWEVVRDMAEQGLSRAQVGKALGYRSRRFEELLREQPENDPFESCNVVAAYIRDTGEGFRAALERMAREHYTLAAAARVIGYSAPETLRQQMNKRGVFIHFQRFDAIGEYERKHGTTLSSALQRMSDRGFSRAAAARAVGLNSSQALAYQMQVRGVTVTFPGRKRRKSETTAPHPWKTQEQQEHLNHAAKTNDA